MNSVHEAGLDRLPRALTTPTGDAGMATDKTAPESNRPQDAFRGYGS